MTELFPEYLQVTSNRLTDGHNVQLHVLGDMQSLADDMAGQLADVIRQAEIQRRGATVIIPVGPVDQFPVLADLINRECLSLRATVLINMDEYLTDDDQWIPLEHPLSFRGFMNRQFYDRLDPELAPPMENRVFPNPTDPGAIGRLIDERGGVDACFGGIGINGHMAFNEPPEPGEAVSNEEFVARSTRILSLSRETRTINAVTVGGDITVIPRRCITVGMHEILASRRLRFYCNRPWQSGVVRRVLQGPITPVCPASFLRTHADASLTLADYVAAPPDIRLR